MTLSLTPFFAAYENFLKGANNAADALALPVNGTALEASSLDGACGIRVFVASMSRIPLHFIRATLLYKIFKFYNKAVRYAYRMLPNEGRRIARVFCFLD
jgi:hypothetical protein